MNEIAEIAEIAEIGVPRGGLAPPPRNFSEVLAKGKIKGKMKQKRKKIIKFQ